MTTIADQNTDYPPPPRPTAGERTLAHHWEIIAKLIEAQREAQTNISRLTDYINNLIGWKHQHQNDVAELTQRLYELEREIEVLHALTDGSRKAK